MAIQVPAITDDLTRAKIREERNLSASLKFRACLTVFTISTICWCLIDNNKENERIELSMHMRSHSSRGSGGDLHTTSSRHASSPTQLTPDIVRALSKADTVIKDTQNLLGSGHGHVASDDGATAVHREKLNPVRGSRVKIGDKSDHNVEESDQHRPAAGHHAHHSTPPESPQELAKEKAESELWNTEQAMKRQLDAQTAHRSGKLWQHTVDIVHRTDPNAKLISKLQEPRHSSAEAAASHVKKAIALKRVESKQPDSMKLRLKAELDARTRDDMGAMEHKAEGLQQKELDEVAHDSKAAETAAAHKSMPLGDMKKMLTSQLDNSVKSADKKPASKNAATASQMEQRLKAELDAKTKSREEKLLQSQSEKRSLVLARRKLHGRVTRAAKVRLQLSKEMREENAIRKQLDLRAEKAGKRMLKHEVSGNSRGGGGDGGARKASRADLEAALRKQLESKERQLLKSGTPSQADKAEEELRRKIEAAKKKGGGGGGGGHAFHLQDYLRKQLDAKDATTQKRLYRRTVQGSLLRDAKRAPLPHKGRDRRLHAAAMRLFKASMRRSKGGGSSAAAAGDKPFAGLHSDEDNRRRRAQARPHPLDVHSETVDLMKSALQRSGGHRPFAALHREEARESRVAAAARSRSVDVHTAVERVMESALQRAKGVRPFADLHKGAAGGGAGAAAVAEALGGGDVHDMAHANAESTLRAGGLERGGKLDALVLGHYKELQAADATEEAIRQARSKAVKEAEQEEQQAVE